MKKMNNKGITLIELLVSLAVLSIFMVTVTYFVTTSSKSTKQTKRQIKVQQDAKAVYDQIYDTVLQATSVRIMTNHTVTAPTTTEAGITKRRSAAFLSDLSAEKPVQFVSKAAYDAIAFANENYSSATDYAVKYKTNGVGKPTTYETNTVGKKVPNSEYVSQAEFEAATESLNGNIGEYGVFDDGEYEVEAISTGPVQVAGTSQYYAILYAKDSKNVYLLKSPAQINLDAYKNLSGADKDASVETALKDSVIAKNCSDFTVKAQSGTYNSLVLKMKFSDAGYTYTLGGTVNIRNAKVMK